MNKVKWVHHSKGVRELMKSPEMMSICQEVADDRRAIAGEGYETNSFTGKHRVNVSISAATRKAFSDNLKNNTLVKLAGG